MYNFVRMINALIREEIIPNPFEIISANKIISMIFTYIIGGSILHFISFNMVGIFYRKGQAPIVGSILYLFSYTFNVCLILNIHKLFPNIIMAISIYIILVIMIFIISNKLKKSIGGI